MSAITIEMVREAQKKVEAIGRVPGYRLLANINLTVPGPDLVVLLKFKERIFSWPWRPFQKTKVIKTVLPDPKIYVTSTPEMVKIFGCETILGHPETLKHLKNYCV
jgi:hypothetical protein